MRLPSLCGALVAACVLVLPASAQVGKSTPISVTRGEFAVAPYGGYLITQRFFEGPLDSSLGVSSAPVYGVQASLPLAPSASLVGTVGYASGNLEVGLPFLGGISIGESDTWILDAAVELRGTFGSLRFIPLAQLGGGAVHRRLSLLGFDVESTDFVVSAGLGADLPITSSISMRLLARDYIGKADFGKVGPLSAKTGDINTVSLSGGLRVAF